MATKSKRVSKVKLEAEAPTPEKATPAVKAPKATDTTEDTSSVTMTRSAGKTKKGGYAVSTQLSAGTSFARFHNVLYNGRIVAGVARDSVLVKRASPMHDTVIDVLTKAGHAPVNNPVEGTRFKGINLQKLAELLEFSVPEVPAFAPINRRSTSPKTAEPTQTATAEPEAPKPAPSRKGLFGKK
jgi:hypothetical protein